MMMMANLSFIKSLIEFLKFALRGILLILFFISVMLTVIKRSGAM